MRGGQKFSLKTFWTFWTYACQFRRGSPPAAGGAWRETRRFGPHTSSPSMCGRGFPCAGVAKARSCASDSEKAQDNDAKTAEACITCEWRRRRRSNQCAGAQRNRTHRVWRRRRRSNQCAGAQRNSTAEFENPSAGGVIVGVLGLRHSWRWRFCLPNVLVPPFRRMDPPLRRLSTCSAS